MIQMDEAAKEAQRQYAKQYREANKEKIAAGKREYYLKNKDKEHDRINKWKRENPDKVKAAHERFWEKKAQALATGPRCQHCGDPFQAKRSDAKFCSARCRVAYNRNK